MKTFDPTKPVQTRDGHKARIICTDRTGTSYPVVALITSGDNEEHLDSFTIDGRAYAHAREERDLDLVNVPETRTEYVNLGTSYTRYEHARSQHPSFDVVKVVREVGGPVVSAEIVTA